MTENFSLQLDYQVNDTNYPGVEGTVLLHFNVTVLPVQIHFPNITLIFTLTRKAAIYAQVRFLLLIVWFSDVYINLYGLERFLSLNCQA